MRVVRTPDERFTDLVDFSFSPNYLEIDDNDGGSLRMHYLDEGPIDGELVLCMHGQPNWSYSYRKMIEPLATAGFRVVVPDMVGFGRSDKPTKRSDYTFARHVLWLESFIKSLDLQNINLIAQDWGGPIALRCLANDPDRFARVLATNTGFGDAKGVPMSKAALLHRLLDATPVLDIEQVTKNAVEAEGDRPGFFYWVKHCDAYEEFDPGAVMQFWLNECSNEEYRAYAAPFPDESFKQGAREFPKLVPMIPDNPAIPANKAAWKVLGTFNKPFLTAFSESSLPTKGPCATFLNFKVYKNEPPVIARFQTEIPGARKLNHVTISNSGHYSQDDAAIELAGVAINFFKTT